MAQNPDTLTFITGGFVNYGAHPAFKTLLSSKQEEGLQGFDLFKNIDSGFLELIQSRKFVEAREIDRYFKEVLQPNFLKIAELVNFSMSDSDIMKSAAIQAVTNMYSALKQEALFRNQGRLYKPQSKSQGSHEEMVFDLNEKGFIFKKLSDRKIKDLWNEIAEWRMQLVEKRKKRPQEMASCTVPLPQEGKKWKILNELLDEAGIKKAISDYSLFPMDLDYYVLQLSHEDERWWKNCYEDVGLPTSQAAYLHYDLDYSLVKAILYLQPVHKENGPFSVIPESRKVAPSYSREAFFKQLDQAIHPLFKNDPDVNFPYYRKHFKLLKYRKEFVKLPPLLRGTSHFGDDLLDGSFESDELLKREQKFLSHSGNFVAFTGGQTIHRGGMVEKGERWAIQIGFRQRDLSWKGSQARLRRRIKGALPEDLVRMIRKSKSVISRKD